MRKNARLRWAAVAVAVGLVTAACGGDDGEDPAGEGAPGGDAAGAAGGDLRIYSSEPAFLVPSAGNDEPSILVMRQLYRGLVRYDAETGAPVNDIAESIESEDNQTWTITLKDGHTFSNGEPVDADSFIRSWNYAGDIDNAQNNSYFMSRIAGFEEMQTADEAPTEFSGLTKVDDLSFTVELTAPFSGFPAIVGYSGFFPMAQECVDDFEACNETPIGNGPYMIDGAWEHNVQIRLTRNEDYAGEDTGKADNLIYRIFDSVDTAYAAFQGGELDVMYTIPPDKFGEARQQYADRLIDQPSDSFSYVGMPLYDDRFSDPKLRQALSLAIDREAIIDAIYDGSLTPAQGLVSPTFDGYREGVCDYCEYDLERAEQLYEESGGLEGGPIDLWANAGAGHDAWLQAVGDGWNSAFGIDYELKVDLEFDEYLELADNEEFTGPFRLGWGPDYPVMETYLQPLYGTDASSNSFDYSNEEFDSLIAEGDAAATLEEAIPFYQQAEDIVAEELPIIPLWFGNTMVIWSENVDEMVYNTISDVEYGQVTMNQ